jgi:hypothetical protein
MPIARSSQEFLNLLHFLHAANEQGNSLVDLHKASTKVDLLTYNSGSRILILMCIDDPQMHSSTHTLTYLCRRDVQNPLVAVGSLAAGLLDDEAHGRALVQQPQLAVLALLVPRVPVDAAVEQRAVEVADEAADVARRVRLPGVAGLLEAVHVLLELVVPERVVALVEGVDLAGLGDLDFLLRQHELAVHGVQREHEHARADGEHEDHRARVHAVARGEEVVSRLTHAHNAPLFNRVELHVRLEMSRLFVHVERRILMARGKRRSIN